MKRQYRKQFDEPTMSDKTLLVSVEDLINQAFGSNKKNRVNFKVIQTILHILARQLHMLEQDVEIKVDEITELAEDAGYNDELARYSSASIEGDELTDKVTKKRGEKREEEPKGRHGKGEKEDGKTSSKDRERKGRAKDRDEKDERSRERDKSSKDRDKKDQRSRERDKSSSRKRGEDDGDEGGRERGRDRERDGERGADGREGRRGEREDRDTQRQDRRGTDFGRQTSGTNITDKRGHAARVRPARIGSTEVVTASQFALLEKAVKQLEQITGPLPEPVLPDNETLRQDLAKGHASLQDTMQAMQLNARLQAAQNGLYRMAQMLTQLAQSGMLPAKFADHVRAMEEYLRVAKAAGYAPPAPGSPGGSGGLGRPGGPGGPDVGRRGKRGKPGKGSSVGRGGTGGTVSTASQMDEKKSTATVATVAEDAPEPGKPRVTHNEMQETLNRMKDAIYREINKLTSQANHSADMASNISRSVAEKLDAAMHVNDRVNSLVQQTEDYAEQLRGFDSGIMTQVNNFQEQLVVMRNDLSGSLALLEASNNNTETTALVDLTERYHGLVVMMESTVYLHQNLNITQVQITDELRSLVQCVETLREQKADRDEVLDGLNDKANLSRLAGLLYEKDFAHARSEIEKRISKCYEIFSRQDMKWRDALRELTAISDNKTELSTLMTLKDATVAELDAIQKLMHKMEIMLGEPKAAILMRKLKDASCSERLTRALVEPQDTMHGKPLPLPAQRPPPLGAEHEPCLGEVNLALPDTRDHTCHHWVGGSHTLMAGNIVKEQAKPMQLQIQPTKKFDAYGSDGKLYMMEEGMQPCADCNEVPPWCSCPHVGVEGCPCAGAGDQASGPPVL